MPEMEDSRPHLELRREEPVVERRPRRGFSGGSPPDDPRRHGAMLGERLQAARQNAETDVGGYDERRLIKITLTDKIQPEQVAQASAGVDIVSQEEDTLLLAFATPGHRGSRYFNEMLTRTQHRHSGAFATSLSISAHPMLLRYVAAGPRPTFPLAHLAPWTFRLGMSVKHLWHLRFPHHPEERHVVSATDG